MSWTDSELNELVRRLAEGQRIKEIAYATGTTSRSVDWAVKRLRDLHGAKTVPHLIALAYQRGILKLP